ncbi:Hpt domain-containing protein [Pseudooceanicola antarcticus]|uniref:Hpt domain-containing protein n=1 Tax=Pseudooceanicola antarcticus TaxID=1247613 RepID=A0A285HSK2_9RHOB|nr:Hpt domain-containing protein [Pseudooceanicola antarcticus]PJE28021.1 Hpt domain-containing protein [Pseudooceanicola antarcticus]SNY38690.1 Hpt domain-containing protein [Pseudooceanicola antarcticus]
MISWTQVIELREDVGHDDFDEVVEIFLEEVEETLTTLAHDGQLEQVLHALKGSALNLGFTHFSGLCAEGEVMAARGEGDAVDLGAIRTSYAESRQIFLSELPQRLAA